MVLLFMGLLDHHILKVWSLFRIEALDYVLEFIVHLRLLTSMLRLMKLLRHLKKVFIFTIHTQGLCKS